MYTLSKLKKMKEVNVKRIFTGKYAKEDNELLKSYFIDALKELFGKEFNIDKLREGPIAFTYENKTMMKPGHYRETIGKVVFRSKDYYFEYKDRDTGEIKKSYGDIDSKCLRDYGFEIDCFNGTIQYRILE